MARPRSLLAIAIRQSSQPALRHRIRRFSSAIPLPLFSLDFSNAYSTSNMFTPAQDARYRDLRRSLDSDADPSHVWAEYTTLLNSVGAHRLPLELHQQVLRCCTPEPKIHCAAIRRRIAKGTFSATYHEHEARLKIVIQNIHSLGVLPTLDDYNFVMHQFAGVGYYDGVIQVYKDLIRVGLTPDYKTFGNAFYSIAYRYSLPIIPGQREDLITHTQGLFRLFMDDMQKHRVPMTAPNIDLTLRILKVTLDRSGLEGLLRWSYGIDLNNPDRVALEYSESATPHIPFPFSTAALNTTLDILGRIGNLSKLVQAFEVLTTPLPSAKQHFFDTFEADDDDDFGVPVDVNSTALSPAQPSIPLPYAQPNTVSYNILLLHVCRQQHAVLARHYLNQAIRHDRHTSWLLRSQVHARVRSGLLHEISAPRFALTRLMLLPVMGEANKDKNLGLMRWLTSKMPYILRKQRADLAFYEPIVAALRAAPSYTSPPPPPSGAQLPVTTLDVDDPTPPSSSAAKTFNPELHVQILRRNISELEQFRKRLDFVLARTSQRVKERLGRRVWVGKDVWFRDAGKIDEEGVSEGGKRTLVTKDRWRQVVNFQDVKPEHSNVPKARSRGPFLRKIKQEAQVDPSSVQKRGMATFARAHAPTLNGAPKSNNNLLAPLPLSSLVPYTLHCSTPPSILSATLYPPRPVRP